MPPLLSLLARCRPPATGRDTRARRNLPTPANPPALAVPVSPQQQQRLTRSSITATLRSDAAGGSRSPNGPWVRASPPPCAKANARPVAGRLWKKGSHQLKLWPLLGTAWQEQVLPDAAGRSHRVHPQLRWRHRPPPMWGFHPPITPIQWHGGLRRAQGALNTGSAPAWPARSRRCAPCASWAVSQSLVSGGGQERRILHGLSSGHAPGLPTAAQGWGAPPDLPGEPRGSGCFISG